MGRQHTRRPGTGALCCDGRPVHARQDEDDARERRVTVEDLHIAPEVEEGTARVLCARCYSLSHYGCALSSPLVRHARQPP